MLRIAFQPISPQEVGNSLIASQNGLGVVPMVRYCTSMISSAGTLADARGPAEAGRVVGLLLFLADDAVPGFFHAALGSCGIDCDKLRQAYNISQINFI